MPGHAFPTAAIRGRQLLPAREQLLHAAIEAEDWSDPLVLRDSDTEIGIIAGDCSLLFRPVHDVPPHLVETGPANYARLHAMFGEIVDLIRDDPKDREEAMTILTHVAVVSASLAGVPHGRSLRVRGPTPVSPVTIDVIHDGFRAEKVDLADELLTHLRSWVVVNTPKPMILAAAPLLVETTTGDHLAAMRAVAELGTI